MAVAYYDLTGDITDLTGGTYDANTLKRVRAWVETNLPPTEAVVDSTGNKIMLGAKTIPLNTDGTFTVSLPSTADSTEIQPNSRQYRVWVEYPDGRPMGQRIRWSSGWFNHTAAGDLADKVIVDYAPVTYSTTLTQQLDAHAATLQAPMDAAVTDAQGYATDAAVSAQQAHDISNISTSDDVMTTIDADEQSAFRLQSDARHIATIATQAAAREAAPKLYYLDAYAGFFRDSSYIWQTGQGNTATTASAAAAAGATTLGVASATGLSAGVVIITGAGTAQMQQRKIASIAGTTLTLDAALTYPVASGATVSPLWTNDRHLTHEGFLAFGYYIANAKKSDGSYVIEGVSPKVTYLCNSWVDQDGPAYSVPLLARIPGATFVDAGVSGNESDLLLARFDTDVPADSDYVVINEPGVNDIANHYSLATMAANLEALWRKTQAIGAVLVYAGPVPLQPYPAESSDRATGMRNLLGAASDFPKVTGAGLPGLVGSANLIVKPNATSLAIGTSALGAYPMGGANTGIGYNVGLKLAAGQNNTLLGYAAGAELTSENYGVGIGALALRNAKVGNTVAVGASALTALTTGPANVAVGYNAGAALTTGGLNTIVGYAALAACVTGGSNSAVGELALASATGSFNCALGQSALNSQTAGSGNVALGYLAGYNVNGDTAKATTTEVNQTIVGRQAGGKGSNTVAVGYAAESAGNGSVALGANTVATGNGSVAIGRDNTGAGASTSTANEFMLGTALHRYKMPGLPTTNPGAGTGILWNNGGVVSVA